MDMTKKSIVGDPSPLLRLRCFSAAKLFLCLNCLKEPSQKAAEEGHRQLP